ncbi:janus kinase and microtubule-interacting protein 1-like [Gigantopelta aegis]|uniref:janus kinase and microtubule-interacting protein 1-like n=1 Tax=Gigantopelta aegis TaxID=1735272 RepID=UPI001B88C27C|nr:janus kinase and microtubule-interacting protein 1-like [Gigantopelta aegis]
MAVAPRNVERRLSESSTDSLKCLNYELREHLCQLRTQLEQQRGSIKQAHWQRVLNIRLVRQQEQKKAVSTIANLRAKLQREKIQELDHQGEILQQKHEQDLAKLRRVHRADVVKLRLEVESKESLLRRFITENRRESMKMRGSESGVTNLIHRLSELRCKKKELEESLTSAGESERHFAYELRRKVEQFQAELWKVRNSSSSEVRKLVSISWS